MSDEIEKRLAEIEARANAATPGPWCTEPRGGELEPLVSEAVMVPNEDYHAQVLEYCGDVPDAEVSANWSFVEQARVDIPYLLSLVRALAPLTGEQAGAGDASRS